MLDEHFKKCEVTYGIFKQYEGYPLALLPPGIIDLFKACAAFEHANKELRDKIVELEHRPPKIHQVYRYRYILTAKQTVTLKKLLDIFEE